MIELRNIAGLVLAGGAGRRMGGANKALVPLAGRPLIAHVFERFAPQVGVLAISANRDADRLAEFGVPILPDRIPGLPGPLAGILAGLEWARSQGASHLVTAAADTPFLPGDLVSRLAAGIDAPLQTVGLASSGGRPHPVFGLWPVALGRVLADRLEGTEDRSVIAFARSNGLVVVEFATTHGEDPFFNINTPDELEEARRRLEASRA